MNKSTRYSPEIRDRAVRMVFEHQAEYDSQWAAIGSIAQKIGCTAETLRKWVRRAERDQGLRAGLPVELGGQSGDPTARADLSIPVAREDTMRITFAVEAHQTAQAALARLIGHHVNISFTKGKQGGPRGEVEGRLDSIFRDAGALGVRVVPVLDELGETFGEPVELVLVEEPGGVHWDSFDMEVFWGIGRGS